MLQTRSSSLCTKRSIKEKAFAVLSEWAYTMNTTQVHHNLRECIKRLCDKPCVNSMQDLFNMGLHKTHMRMWINRIDTLPCFWSLYNKWVVFCRPIYTPLWVIRLIITYASIYFEAKLENSPTRKNLPRSRGEYLYRIRNTSNMRNPFPKASNWWMRAKASNAKWLHFRQYIHQNPKRRKLCLGSTKRKEMSRDSFFLFFPCFAFPLQQPHQKMKRLWWCTMLNIVIK